MNGPIKHNYRGDIICSYCKGEKSGVIDTRGNRNKTRIRRRRECRNCKKRFTTYELREAEIATLKPLSFLEYKKASDFLVKVENKIKEFKKLRKEALDKIPDDDYPDSREEKKRNYQRQYYKTVTSRRRLKERIERLEKRILGAK